jgi:hypothetical protein
MPDACNTSPETASACSTCPSGCSTCDYEKVKCTACKEGFVPHPNHPLMCVLAAKQIVAIRAGGPVSRGCSQWNSQLQCVACFEGFDLHELGTCVPSACSTCNHSAALATVNACSDCPTGCTSCNYAQNQCFTCATGLENVNGACVQPITGCAERFRDAR